MCCKMKRSKRKSSEPYYIKIFQVLLVASLHNIRPLSVKEITKIINETFKENWGETSVSASIGSMNFYKPDLYFKNSVLIRSKCWSEKGQCYYDMFNNKWTLTNKGINYATKFLFAREILK